MATENNQTTINPNNMSVVQRVKTPTPKFFRTLRTIGLALAAIGGAILASPVALKGTITGGTGAAALALGRPAAGKTGTSQSNASAWFSAYTPQLAASVALFRDSASESLNGIGGLTSVTGGTFPARIWTAFMKGALKGEPVMDFPAPSNIGGLDPIVITSGGKQTRKP
jgi:membrane carboxypeptidase/penicillin-binding protein